MPMDEYLRMASLSPWVPVPDAVARRALDVSGAGSDDVHYDLGCGDGRLNIHAIDAPYTVRRTVGIDVDPEMIRRARDRLDRRHPRPGNVEFVVADLVDPAAAGGGGVWDRLGEECTVLTMYFVEEALQRLRPRLMEKLATKSCRVVTVGYEMKGWQPEWVEVNLGLPLFMYKMSDLVEALPTEEDMRAAMGDEVSPEELDLLREPAMTRPDWLPPLEAPPTDYYYEPNEGVDGHWDDFDDETDDDSEVGEDDAKTKDK